MGRAGAGTGAAGRALSPLRSRLRHPGAQRTYLSISHLRSLHLELVELLECAGAAALTPFPVTDGATLSKRQGRRLVEILRAIAELVSEGRQSHLISTAEEHEATLLQQTYIIIVHMIRALLLQQEHPHAAT